jgi:Tol biopolymer transport system component
MAEVVVDDLKVRACASEDCAEVGAVPRGERVEVFGCLTDNSWCEVSWSGGRGWCTGQSLRQLAVATVVPVVEVVLPTATPGVVSNGEGKIAFVSNRDGNDEIYVMSVDGSSLKRLTNDPTNDQHPAWSSDGQRIAFSRNGIYVMNADGSSQTRLTEFGEFPSWSPDGTRIAFSYVGKLYVVNADGSGLTHLANNSNSPTWLPDGRHIAYFLGTIYIVKIDDNGMIRLLNGTGPNCGLLDTNFQPIRCQASIPNARWADWSPDGQQIVFEFFERDDRNYDIYKMNSDGNLTRLTNHPSRDTHPTWSPDGQRIAFMSERDGNEEIYVMNADGSNQIRLTNDPANDWGPAWSR